MLKSRMVFNCLYSWNELGTREVKGVGAPIAIGLLPVPMPGLPVPLPVLLGNNCIVLNSELSLWCHNFKNVTLSTSSYIPTYRDEKKRWFVCGWCCEKILPGPAWALLRKTCKPFFLSTVDHQTSMLAWMTHRYLICASCWKEPKEEGLVVVLTESVYADKNHRFHFQKEGNTPWIHLGYLIRTCPCER